MIEIAFDVPLEPKPKGSFVGIPTESGRVVFKNDNPGTKPFQQYVALLALNAARRAGLHGPRRGPVELDLLFVLSNPKKLTGPDLCKPDLDKLQRTILDALSGVVYLDDKQVIRILAEKAFVSNGRPARAEIRVWLI